MLARGYGPLSRAFRAEAGICWSAKSPLTGFSETNDECSTSGQTQAAPHNPLPPQHANSLVLRRWLASRSSNPSHPHSSLPSKESERSCWSCDHVVKRGGLVCRGCETVQPVDASLNYYEIFGLPSLSFEIDLAELERRYKRLQWNLHPDKVVLRPRQEQEFSTQQASLVNRAYSVLKSPLARANYILMLKGVSAGDQFEGTISDSELLMEVLEAREEVDSSTDPAVLHGLLESNRKRQEGVVRRLSHAFKEGDYALALSQTTQLSYLVRLEQEIVNKL